MPDVFISYSVKDEEMAQFVREQLTLHELNVFLASISLTPGERWTPRIIDELRSSEWVFLLATQNALASPNVQLEVGGAIFGKKKLVPIMWDVKPSDLPTWISEFQGLTLSGTTVEEVRAQVTKLAVDVKASKTKGQLVAGAVIAGLLYFFSRS